MKLVRFGSCLVLAACLVAPSAVAETAASTEEAHVLVMGTFHFANPGLDMVKSQVTDVLSASNQRWLDTLATRIAAFAPTDVLVECAVADQPKMDARLLAYRAGGYALARNENDQIGLRVAKAANARLVCFDQRDVHWEGDKLMKFLEENEPQALEEVQKVFADLSARETREQGALSLAQLLRLSNSSDRDRENKNLYLMTNAVDAGSSYAGADASASWWRRNFHMYANVQKAAQPGRRVFVLAGAGHTAVIRDLLANDAARTAVDIGPYLAD